MEQHINPEHYQLDVTGKQAIDVIKEALTEDEFTGYLKGSKLKYKLRAGKKKHITMDMLRIFTEMLPKGNVALMRDDVAFHFRTWMNEVNKEMVAVDAGKQKWFEEKILEELRPTSATIMIGNFVEEGRDNKQWYFATSKLRCILRVYQFNDDISSFYIDNLSTSLPYRGNKLASTLINSAIDFCFNQNAEVVKLWCSKISFVYHWYLRLGFTDTEMPYEGLPGCVWLELTRDERKRREGN